MSFSFRPARRAEAKPLIGLYAESGCGKTYSALLLARGFAGPTGKVGMIETEGGRGEAYEDLIPGSYDVLSLRENYAPTNYGQAITAAEKAGLDALIIDSASHEWEGVGGVLDLAAKEKARLGARGVGAWAMPKAEHQKHFMSRLQTTVIPLVIVCMRAKYPMTEQFKKGSTSEKEWVRSDVLEPKQADDILFEMFIHGWIGRDHRLHVTRWGLDSLRPVIIDAEPISLATGERLAAWAKGQQVADQLASLVAAGDAAARGGKDALTRWWKGLTDFDRNNLGSARRDGWAAIAKSAETSSSQQQVGDDDERF